MTRLKKYTKKAKSALLIPEISASLSHRFLKADRANHGMAFELIVSLTSFPKRFSTLAYTIKSLRSQQMVPDRIILWIFEADITELPRNVTDLQDDIFQIQSVDQDLRSYKKLVPAVRAYPEACIVTTDDDLFYDRSWLAQLMQHVDADSNVICGTRGHKIRRQPDGAFAPYNRWKHNVPAGDPSPDILLTSGAGMAFPPGAFAPEALKDNAFMSLSPTSDDLWFYFMLRQRGYSFRKVGAEFQLFTWRRSQGASLWAGNQQDGNDEAFGNLLAAFGPPF